MNWHNLIESRNVKTDDIVLFSTATTGLGTDDLLLAFSYAKLNADGTVSKDTIYRLVGESACEKSMAIHKISTDLMIKRGYVTHDFEKQINEATNDMKCILFSYNPTFQHKALSVMAGLKPAFICDLPLFLKAAESRIAISKEDLSKMLTIPDLQMYLEFIYRKGPSLKTMMANRDFKFDACNDVLPVQQNVDALVELWELLGQQEVISY